MDLPSIKVRHIRATILMLTLAFQSQQIPISAVTINRKYTISGYITDGTSKETLIGANIFESHHKLGATTNPYGFYSLTLPAGEIELSYSYTGYDTQTKTVDLRKDTIINILLKDNNLLNEVVIVSNKSETGLNATLMSAMDIPIAQIRNTPSILGEADVLKAIQLVPGVQSGTEGSAGIHVRGGGPDQNLILLDGVPLYNVEHVFGFFSVFTPEAVKKVNFFKGSFPARFGGRLSSVINVRTNDGNMQKYHGGLSIGLLSSKINLEGPIIKDKTSFTLSARRSYIDLLMRPFMPKDEKSGYDFYDINGKINHKFNDRSRLFLSAYHGRDNFHYKYSSQDNSYKTYTSSDKQTMHWGNTVYAMRWNYIFNNKLFSNTTVAYNKYLFNTQMKSFEQETQNGIKRTNEYRSDYNSSIRDWTYNIDFDYNPSPAHHIKFGGGYLYHTFNPEIQTSRIKDETSDTLYNINPNKRIYAHEGSLYAEDNFTLSEKMSLNLGLHFSLFNVQKKSYFSLQPRASIRYEFPKDITLKASYTKMNQYINLLSSSTISMPTDLWVPVTKNIKPMSAHQYSVGAYYNGIKGWEFSIEGYYKDMRNVLEYKDGTNFFGNSSNWEEKVEMGKGRSFGLEFQVQKTLGKTTGWLSYTLAKSDRQFGKGGINNGERFPYKYDRRHSISLTVSHKFNDRIDINATWTFATGNYLTLSNEQTSIIRPEDADKYSGYYAYQDSGISDAPSISSRNNYRLPASHRLNIGVNFRKKTKHGERIWNVGLYNAYNTMNPNFVYWKYKDGQKILTKMTILPCIPSFSYTYKF